MEESLIDKDEKRCKCSSTTKLAIIFLSGAMVIILSIVIALIILKPSSHTKPTFRVKYYSMLNNIQDNVSLEDPYISCPEEATIYPNKLKAFPSVNGTACAAVICSRDFQGIISARINYDQIDRYIHNITIQEAGSCSLVHYITPVNRYSVNVTGYCCDV